MKEKEGLNLQKFLHKVRFQNIVLILNLNEVDINKKLLKSLKYFWKLNRPVQWLTIVVPATWEAEAGQLLEPRRWTLLWAKITPLHSSVDNKSETLSKKKKYYSILWIYFKQFLTKICANILTIWKKLACTDVNEVFEFLTYLFWASYLKPTEVH